MGESLDVEHQRRLRAERVQAMLQMMWGDELPPGPNAALTFLIDAVGADDAHSLQDQLIGQGDGLSYQLLAALWRHHRTWLGVGLAPQALADSSALGVGSSDLQLPPVLQERLQALRLLPGPLADLVAPAPAPAPAPVFEVDPRTGPTPLIAQAGEAARVGMWELDPQTATVAFDAVTAALLGAGQVGGHAALDQLKLVHPEDRERVVAALQHAMATRMAYQMRFRVRSPSGVITHLISHGRVLSEPSDPSARLTGYLTIDREEQQAAEHAAGRGPRGEGAVEMT